MAEQILDGTGTGKRAKVDQNSQIHTTAITQTETQDAVDKGDAYNINTGTIGLTSSTASGVLYFKNDEDASFVIDAIAVGITNPGTQARACIISLISNPTAGTLIAGASAVDMNQNRNFGSSKALKSTTLAYKGAEGNTVTDGDDIALFYQNVGTRGYYSIDFELPKGSSIALTIDTQTTSGTTNLYAAIIGHVKDPNNK